MLLELLELLRLLCKYRLGLIRELLLLRWVQLRMKLLCMNSCTLQSMLSFGVLDKGSVQAAI